MLIDLGVDVLLGWLAEFEVSAGHPWLARAEVLLQDGIDFREFCGSFGSSLGNLLL